MKLSFRSEFEFGLKLQKGCWISFRLRQKEKRPSLMPEDSDHRSSRSASPSPELKKGKIDNNKNGSSETGKARKIKR
jgi:hypothetical protein